MLDRLNNFVDGIASGIAKGVNELAEEAKEKRASTATKKTSGNQDMLKRIEELERQMKIVMELIASLQREAMGGAFDDSEPEVEQEEPA